MKSPSQVISLTPDLSEEFRNQNKDPLNAVINGGESWKSPQGSNVKINTDAAFLAPSGSAGLGFVIRNKEGLVMASGGKCLQDV